MENNSDSPEHGDGRAHGAGDDAIATRFRRLAREADELAVELRRARSGGPGGAAPVNSTLQRLDLLTAMLASEARRAAADEDGPGVGDRATAGRSLPGFATMPLVIHDGKSVGFEVPGIGSVSIAADGASAAIDGVGSLSIGEDGVSVSAGGAQVSVGGNGARVAIPGTGTVEVGTDGHVSIGPSPGGSPAPGAAPGLGLPPLPCLEACEFKIPIPVPKFVAEPFEITVGVPKVETHPVPFPIPVPTPSPWNFQWPQLPNLPDLPSTPPAFEPVPIPYPTIGGLVPGIPGSGGFGYNPGIEGLVARLLAMAMTDAKDPLREADGRVEAWRDALGDPVDVIAFETKKKLQELVPPWEQVQASVQNLHEELASNFGFVTDAARGRAVLLRQSLREIIARLRDLLSAYGALRADHDQHAVGSAASVVSPAATVLAALRGIFLIVNWIATRVFSVDGFAGDLYGEIIEFGIALNSALEAME